MKLHHRSSAQGATHAVAPGCSVVIRGPVAEAQVVQPSAKLTAPGLEPADPTGQGVGSVAHTPAYVPAGVATHWLWRQ